MEGSLNNVSLPEKEKQNAEGKTKSHAHKEKENVLYFNHGSPEIILVWEI